MMSPMQSWMREKWSTQVGAYNSHLFCASPLHLQRLLLEGKSDPCTQLDNLDNCHFQKTPEKFGSVRSNYNGSRDWFRKQSCVLKGSNEIRGCKELRPISKIQIHGSNGIRSFDLFAAGAVLYQLSFGSGSICWAHLFP